MRALLCGPFSCPQLSSERIRRLSLPRPRTGAALALTALVGVSTLLRLWGALRVPSPWFTPDEMVYGELGRSLWESGGLTILGHTTPFFSLVYPALVGPFLSLGNLALGYSLLKGVQALVMSLTAVPVFLWGRSLVRPRWALVAALLTLAVPGLAFAGFVMTEVAFYPVICVVAWAMARALERPTALRQALAVAGIALATATRLQAIVLVPVLVLAILLKAALDRTLLSGVRRFTPLVGSLLAIGAAGVAFKLARGGSPLGSVLGAYKVTGHVSYEVGDAVRFAIYHAADLLLMTALLPVFAVVLVLVEAAAGRERSEAVRAYLAVTVSLCLGFVAEVGLFTSRLLGRLAERNLLALSPLLFIGFVIWLDRGLPRRLVPTAAASLGALGLLLYLPWDRFVTAAAEPDAFSVIPLYKLRVNYPGLDTRLVVVLGAVELLALAAFLPRRRAWILPLAVFALFVGASISATQVVSHQARLFRLVMVGPDRRWIDEHAPGPVSYVYTGELGWSGGAPVWTNLFWNRRIRRVYDLGAAPALGPLPQQRVVPDGKGRLRLEDGRQVEARYVVAVGGLQLVGTPIVDSRPAPLVLWKITPPLRLAPPG
ncbi:MAG TPA: glycosyltransferase family 39 protein [Gaiellaceae bacterium]|nr:glycosyltransferase family 39 protein [Gaiellaceae bacterium]